MRGTLFLLICFVSFSFSEKLSAAEDEERSKSCGRVSNPKSASNDDLSPWAVRLYVGSKHTIKNVYNPATLLSKRHVITSALVLIDNDADRWRWETDGSSVDVTTVMEVSRLNELIIDLEACSNNLLCPHRMIPLKSAFYLGPCDSSALHTGVILIETVDDIPDDPVYFVPACVAESNDVLTEGESLYVQEAAHSNGNRLIEIIQAKVTTCGNPSNQELCAKLDKCLSGTGGGLMKKKDGRDTLVGSSEYYYNSNCKLRKFGSVPYNTKNICELAGICKTTSTERPKPIPPPTPISLTNPFRKLSPAENSQNTNTCGKPTNPGSKSPIDLTPWTINVLVQHPSEEFYTPATLISKRHVVVPAFALISDESKSTRLWKPDKTAVDMSACKNNMMEIPKEYLSKTTIELSTCYDVSKCGSNVRHSVKTGVYLGVCHATDISFGVILLEMDKDLPANLPYFVPSCLAEKRMPQLENNLELHSIGSDSKGSYTRTISGVETVKCEYTLGHYSKICSISPTCYQGYSGGVMRSVNGKQTLVGVLYYRDPECKMNHIVSMEILSDQICHFAGICSEKPNNKKPNENRSSKKQGQRAGSNSGEGGSETDGGEESSSSLAMHSGVVILIAFLFFYA